VDSARPAARPAACFDGHYPISMDEEVRRTKLMLEPAGLASASRP
jgi:amidophosphoribosyltransferase